MREITHFFIRKNAFKRTFSNSNEVDILDLRLNKQHFSAQSYPNDKLPI